jgi:SAM-dependent methyltransferase
VTEGPAIAAYAVEQFRDPAAELERLQQQAALLAVAEGAALQALGLPALGRVLDVGCGPGFVAARIRKAWPGLEIIGVDRDAAVLEKARQVMPVYEGSAERLPFPAEQFDCVYARLVLRHLGNPDAALGEMYRVLRPGGRAIVIDSDDGALVLHPRPADFDRALHAREKTFQRRGADPFIGRRLPALFGAAGFVDLTLRSLVVDSVSVGLGPFARIVLTPVADAIDSDLLDAAGVAAAVAAIDGWSRDEAAFGLTTVVALGGSKR